VDCQQCRDQISAQLDGEPVTPFEDHLDGCAECRTWLDKAAAVTRLTRIGLAVPSVGVPSSVLDAAPKPRRNRLVTGLRIALGTIGAAQLFLAVAQIAGAAMAGMSTAASAQGASPDHLLHETAAWNIGVGVAFLLIAGRFARPASVVGILTAFVGALLLLSAGDFIEGAVAWSRLASHILLIAGYAVVVVLSRPRFRQDDPPAFRNRGSRWRLSPPPAARTAPLPGPGRAARAEIGGGYRTAA
jgi:predicted anti-sigma-YlaC factor YlaD